MRAVWTSCTWRAFALQSEFYSFCVSSSTPKQRRMPALEKFSVWANLVWMAILSICFCLQKLAFWRWCRLLCRAVCLLWSNSMKMTFLWTRSPAFASTTMNSRQSIAADVTRSIVSWDAMSWRIYAKRVYCISLASSMRTHRCALLASLKLFADAWESAHDLHCCSQL